MDKYKCNICGWIYDPELGDHDGGIEAGTPFIDSLYDDVPAGWTCPKCGAKKSQFTKI